MHILFEILIFLCTQYYYILYYQIISSSFHNVNKYYGKRVILRKFANYWLLRFKGMVPLFYGIDFSPIFAVITFKTFIKFLKHLKRELC